MARAGKVMLFFTPLLLEFTRLHRNRSLRK
jgi:hypothetical protein